MKDRVHLKFNRPISGHTLEMAKLYTAFGNLEYTQTVANIYEYDLCLKPLIDLLEYGAKKHFQWNFVEQEKKKIRSDINDNIIVCFSGGKDSTSAALKMKAQGYNVYLYYMFGINKSYPDEFNRVLELAKDLGMPLYVEKVAVVGHASFRDNPIKNQFIASMALDYGINNGISTKICFGDFTDDNIYNSSFLEAWSDTQEMWEAHEEFVRQYVPFYEIKIPFKNYRETLDVISSNEHLLRKVQGCVLPHRFRNKTKEINEMKYNVKLLPNRCGSCWKCCVEYIYLADIEAVEYNRKFYRHCLDFLKSKMNVLHNEIIGRDDEIVYKTFLFSDFKESKYYNDIAICGK